MELLMSRRGAGTGAGVAPTGRALGTGGGPPRPGTAGGGPRLGIGGGPARITGGGLCTGGTFFGEVGGLSTVLPSDDSSGATCVRGRGRGRTRGVAGVSVEFRLSSLLLRGRVD